MTAASCVMNTDISRDSAPTERSKCGINEAKIGSSNSQALTIVQAVLRHDIDRATTRKMMMCASAAEDPHTGLLIAMPILTWMDTKFQIQIPIQVRKEPLIHLIAFSKRQH